MNRSTPRHLLHYVTRRLRLRQYLEDPGDGRQQPQIPAQALLWALLIGQILRQSSFHAVEALVRSSARRTLAIATPFCDDTLGYFTERLDPHPTRQALLSLIRGAKRNKAFDDCRCPCRLVADSSKAQELLLWQPCIPTCRQSCAQLGIGTFGIQTAMCQCRDQHRSDFFPGT